MTLPRGWEWKKVGDLGVEVKGNTKPDADVDYEMYSVPAFAMGSPELLRGSEIGSTKRPVKADDLLLCKINPRINRVWWVDAPIADRPQLASSEYLVLRLHDEYRSLLRYLVWYLRSPAFRSWIELNVEGATGSHTRAKSPAILNQTMPVAPPASRGRIVAEIEKQFTRLEAAIQYLNKAERRLHQLHDQVLTYGTEDELIPLGELLNEPLANGRSVVTEPAGFPVLRLTALKAGRIDTTERKGGAWSRDQAMRFLIHEKDFLISRGNGSLSLVGRGGLVGPVTEEIAYPDTMIRARVDAERISPHFLRLIWDTAPVRRQLERAAKTTAGIYKVNQQDLSRIEIPVPSIDDQLRFVAAADRQLSLVGRILAEIAVGLNRAEQLRQSVLSAAFAGRLESRAFVEEMPA